MISYHSTYMRKQKMKSNELITAKQLLETNLPEIKYLVEEILPSGLTIFAGRPKSGKSFLVLDLAITIASGGMFLQKYRSIENKVLYISNEDSYNRLQKRMKNIVLEKEIRNIESLENFYLDTDFPKLNEAGYIKLLKVVEQNKIGLVIIDTFQKQISASREYDTIYGREYKITGRLQTFATENNIGLLTVHHTRKSEADNPTDAILGTTGISGSADTIWVLSNQNGKPILELQGKDIEPQSLQLEFKNSIWRYKQDFVNLNLTPERQEIYNLLIKEGRVMKTGEIAEKLNKEKNNISTLLKRMVNEGVISNPSYGEYSINR